MVHSVTLNEKQHSVKMMRNLKLMQNEEDLCDFVIKVGSDVYHAHRNILSAGSEYFRAMLKHDTKESREGTVEMKEVDSECVKNCIEYIYSAKFDVPDDKIGDFLHVAIMMQLEDVIKAVEDILGNSLSVESFYTTKKFADTYRLESVSKKCKTYCERNLLLISAQPEFKDEKLSYLIIMLGSKKLNMHEEEKLSVLLKWAAENTEERENLKAAFEFIKLESLSSSFLENLLQKDPVISNDLSLIKLHNDALLETSKESGEAESSCKSMMLFGGSDRNDIRMYEIVTNEVKPFAIEEFPRNYGFSAIALDSYVYILCDCQSVYRINFKVPCPKWEKMRDMIDYHGSQPPSAAGSNSLYVVGAGGSLSVPVTSVEQFHPNKNRWVELRDKPYEMLNASLVSLDDFLFCIGGQEVLRSIESFSKFTPAISKWVDLPPMRNARSRCGAVGFQQKIFVMGGTDRLTPVEGECYDVLSAQWTYLSSNVTPCGVVNAHSISGCIYVICYDNTIEKYDIESDTWHKVEVNFGGEFRIDDSALIEM